jgi:hypothetical protein
MRHRYQKRHAMTGLIAGAVSGLAGTVMMTQFQNLWNKLSEDMSAAISKETTGAHRAEKEDSIMKAAGKISKGAGYYLSRRERKKAGPFARRKR